ncbi:MAG: tRNA (adenosine(37)-N6)-threonylcarbamoyltransferase complex ATPase subunit type 1 TsaE [Rhodospirillales bacterium]|jgi:tRNA threonylcarbamoyladenosine biosynthesis protein TsaE
MIINLADEQATLDLAAKLAGHAKAGDVIALSGELGAGKTTFARSFIQTKRHIPEDVPSPTFTLVQTYETGDAMIHHFDFYRLNDPEEAYELDIEDAFMTGISLIEWPEKIGVLIPTERLDIRLEFSKNPQARQAILTGHRGWISRLQEIELG